MEPHAGGISYGCAVCQAPLSVWTFPALYRASTPASTGESVQTESESTCYFHPQKRAAESCEKCGRFLCALCDIELDGNHFCPGCTAQGTATGSIQRLENRRILYGPLSFMLAALPLFFAIVTIVTAPAAIYVAIRYWKAPMSLVRPGRVSFIAAILLAVIELVAWAVIITALVTAKHHS